MRIAYVAFSGIPSLTAQSINVFRACSALSELGHEVVLIVPDQHPNRIRDPRDLGQFYNLPFNFKVKYLPCPGWRGGRTLFSLLARRHIARMDCDLVISRYLRVAVSMARRGTPVVYELHAPIKSKGSMITKLANAPGFRLLVTHTQEIKLDIDRHQIRGLDASRVYAIPNGRDPVSTDIRAKPLDKHTDGLDIGYTGKLQTQKGMGIIAEVADKVRHHDFHIIGGDEAQLSEWMPKMDWPHVHFYGYVPQGDTDAYIAAMDACLLPNVPHHENPAGVLYSSPMKTLDYMAHAKLILASDLTEIRELVSDREAMLLPHDQAAVWVSAINALSRDHLPDLGPAARERLIREFTMQARYGRIIDAAGCQPAPAGESNA